MFSNVSILFAYQPDNGPRDSAFEWIQRYYKTTLPNVELCIGISESKLFNRSQGLNSAAKQATRDIFVICDGDVIVSPASISDAISCLKKYPWVIPFHHRKILNLSQKNTKKLLKSKPQWPLEIKIKDFEVETRDKNFAGKLNVITRDNYFKVGGFDERFVGYGWEDNAFAYALTTICGLPKRLDWNIYHLWHPPVPSKGNPVWEKNKILGLQYKAAVGNQEQMFKLIRERD